MALVRKLWGFSLRDKTCEVSSVEVGDDSVKCSLMGFFGFFFYENTVEGAKTSLSAANNRIAFCFRPLPLSTFSTLALLFPSVPSLAATTLTTFFFKLSVHFLPHLTHLTLFLCHPVWLPAPFGRDSSDRFQGAGRADQRASASRWCAIDSASHGPTGWTPRCPA